MLYADQVSNPENRGLMSVVINCTVRPGAVVPVYQTTGSSGADICAYLSEPVVINPGNRTLIPTGLSFQIPAGYEIQVRPRSGLALKHGITVLNSPGTIDSDYRGEVGVILIHLGTEPFTVYNGDRIAQLVVAQTEQSCFAIVENLDETPRGTGGYGSTGQQ